MLIRSQKLSTRCSALRVSATGSVPKPLPATLAVRIQLQNDDGVSHGFLISNNILLSALVINYYYYYFRNLDIFVQQVHILLRRMAWAGQSVY